MEAATWNAYADATAEHRKKSGLYPWYLWPGLSSSHLQSSGAEGIQLLWLSILMRFEKFSRQWRQTVQTDPPKCKLCHETETLKMRFKMGCYELWCCYTSPKRWLDLSGWRKSKSSNLGFFSTFFSFRPAMFLVLYNFLANRAWHSKNIGFAGEPSSGHKNAWKHRNFRNLEIKQFQIQGK